MKKCPILYNKKKECTGCTACYAICSYHAISMIEDEEGFLYPKIESELCVGCRRCVSVCPNNIDKKR